MPVDPDLFRGTLSNWASGVTVVTSRRGEDVRGMTASAFCSVSLDPPLVLVCVDKSAIFHDFVSKSGTFAINMRLMGGSLGDSVRTAYLLCRSADALEDSWRGDAGEIRDRFGGLVAAIDGQEAAARQLASRAARSAAGRPDLELVRVESRVEHGGALDLGEVGVLAVHPEQRHARDAGALLV